MEDLPLHGEGSQFIQSDSVGSEESRPSAQHTATSAMGEAQVNPTDVQKLLRGRFNVDFQPPTASIPSGFRKVVSPSDLQSFMSVAATFRPKLPMDTYSGLYAEVSNTRVILLQKAGSAACAAYEIAYGDQIAVFSAFMTSTLGTHQIPYQPQTSLQRALMRMHQKRRDDSARLAQFAAMLPGFEDVSPTDRAILMAEKTFVSTLLHHMKYFYKGEFYCPLPGPEQIHASSYWMTSMGVDPELVRFCCEFSHVYNGIGLTLAESYLLLAAAFFDPCTTTASDKPLLGHLYSFYKDTLMYMIGYRRRDPVECAAVYHKLDEAGKMLQMAYQLALEWYTNVEQTLPPFPAPLRTLLQDCLQRESLLNL
ncbi:uncharacterized protein LOC129588928 [Paramacrobiotus metropolitanus]|uniref:uncharacterized protein LOC129588928 n=1 Tax=Paramacrobiotus metropolitanus TaxID=2943436 RepID=UPI00244610FA|nr:uncharacterized protein LOC129588928 [Paramacrobiotus metropolitanus]